MEVTAPHPLIPNVATSRLLAGDGGTTSALMVNGFKWNVTGTLLVNASVLTPLNEAGLTGGSTPSLSLDYTFD